MSLTRKIAYNTSVQIAGKIVSTILGLVAVMVMTRGLGVEQFGWYVTATAFLQFIGIFSDFGFTLTAASMLSEPLFDKQKLLNTLFTWRLLTALLFQGAAPLLILLFPYPRPVKIAVAVVAISFFCQSLNQIFIGYFQTRLKTIHITIGELLSRLVLVGGTIMFAWQQSGFLPVMTAIAVGSLISTIYLWFKSPGIKLTTDRTISRAIFSKTWPMALSIIFNSFYLQGDRVILPLYVSQADVGLYGAAYRVLDIIVQMAAIIMGIMLPLITFAWSRQLLTNFKKHYQTSLEVVTLFLLPALAGVLVLAKPIMRFVAGDNFAGAGAVLRILSFAILGICLGMVFGYINLAIGRQRQALFVYLSDAILSVIGYFIFIPHYGIMGAAGVTVFSELYAGILLFALASYYSGCVPRLFNFFKILLASAVMGTALMYLQPLNLIWSILIGLVIYAAIILLLRVATKATLKEILTSAQVAEKPQI